LFIPQAIYEHGEPSGNDTGWRKQKKLGENPVVVQLQRNTLHLLHQQQLLDAVHKIIVAYSYNNTKHINKMAAKCRVTECLSNDIYMRFQVLTAASMILESSGM
jgi:hypothetical protein